MPYPPQDTWGRPPCYGTCRTCGKPAPKEGKYYRTYCRSCEPKRENCSQCGKPRDGSHASYCVACFKEYERDWAKANPEKVRLKERGWRSRNVEALQRKERRRTLAKHDLTTDEFATMLAAQDSRCAICHRTAAEAGRPWDPSPRRSLPCDGRDSRIALQSLQYRARVCWR